MSGLTDSGDVLLRVENLVKYFPLKSSQLFRRQRDFVHAVDDVSLEVKRGETLGLVGETGCGKTTLARCVTRLYDITSGRITFDGTDISKLSARRMRPFRREIQMIFQDPYGSLNPRRRVGSIIGDPFAIHKTASGQDRKPAEFSGGQRQRIGVARALAFKPQMIVCDEPVSALDVSIQAQIINLLADLQAELGLTYIFIAHDLSVVRHVSDRVAVMYLGKVVEEAPVEQLWALPRHPYSDALLSAVPIPDIAHIGRERIILAGDVPSPIAPPPGCRFHPRCPKAGMRCVQETPDLVPQLGDPAEHLAACHFPVQDGRDRAGRRSGRNGGP